MLLEDGFISDEVLDIPTHKRVLEYHNKESNINIVHGKNQLWSCLKIKLKKSKTYKETRVQVLYFTVHSHYTQTSLCGQNN